MVQVKASNETEGSGNQKKLSCHLQITEISTKMKKRPKNSLKQDIILKNIISSAAVLRIWDVYPGSEFLYPGPRSQ
jgi:hypothetical protein